MAGTITDIVLSITFVVIYKSIWGYVAARIAAGIVNVTMTYVMCSYRPKFHFVPEKAKELWKYGKWLFGSYIINYLLEEGDDWFVWFYLGGDPFLKLYRYAYRFSLMPTTHIIGTIAQVVFPAFSKIQDNLPRLREAYFKTLRTTALISIPMSFLIFSLGPDFVRLFLVEESHGLIVPLQILAIVGLITSIGSVIGPVLKAIGKLSPVLYFQFIRLFLVAIMIYPFTKRWGIAGTALTIAIVRLLLYFPGIIVLSKLLKSSLWRMFEPLIVPMIGSTVMISCCYLLKAEYFTKVTIFSFCSLSVMSIGLYILFILLIGKLFKNKNINNLFNALPI